MTTIDEAGFVLKSMLRYVKYVTQAIATKYTGRYCKTCCNCFMLFLCAVFFCMRGMHPGAFVVIHPVEVRHRSLGIGGRLPGFFGASGHGTSKTIGFHVPWMNLTLWQRLGFKAFHDLS